VKLLVTRPEPDGERTAATLRARGHQVLLAPLSRIAFLTPELGAGPWAAVLITSANAARAIERHPQREALAGLPVVAVGEASAAAARAAGFTDVAAAEGDAQRLAGRVAAQYAGAKRPLLYLAGADRVGDLVGDLAGMAVAVDMAVVYRAAIEASLPAAVVAALERGRVDGVLHFSRRSAAAFLQAVARAGLTAEGLMPAQICLSSRIAAVLVEAGAAKVQVSPHPDEESLLRLIDLA
jgi:uroporphyrinogen-III synthase